MWHMFRKAYLKHKTTDTNNLHDMEGSEELVSMQETQAA